MSSDEELEQQEWAKRPIRRFLPNRKFKRRHLGTPADSIADDATDQIDLLDFVLFVVNRNIPVPINADFKPRDRWGLLGDGASYLAYKIRLPDPDEERVGKYWMEGTDIVLKRTYSSSSSIQMPKQKQSRFLPVMSELAVLWHQPIMEHENIIESLGVTWDIEQGAEPSIWPVLLLEYSECGSLAGLNITLSFEQQTRICIDIANALLCLHSCGVAHCDVKSENVLLFVEYNEDEALTFTAKLNDFGSAVLNVSPDTDLPNGIVRTKPWSAPEAANHLKGLDVFKTDIFSFGMLFWRVILNEDLFFNVRSTDRLEELEEMKKTGEILQLALATVSRLYSGSHAVIAEKVLKLTLPASPHKRATGFESVLSILTGEEIQSSSSERIPLDISNDTYFENIEQIFGLLEEQPQELKTAIVTCLSTRANKPRRPAQEIGEAAYQLALCYCNAFGATYDCDEALQWLLNAARLGSLKAQAEIQRFSSAINRRCPANLNELEQWLFDSTASGSLFASRDLRVFNPERYSAAIEARRRRLCRIDANDDTFQRFCRWMHASSRTGGSLQIDPRDGPRFLHLAASIGDSDALNLILSDGLDVNVVNEFDETAILFAFRSGNVQVVPFLIQRGAHLGIASSNGETPLHWLISINPDELDAIRSILLTHVDRRSLEMRCRPLHWFHRTLSPQGTPLDTATNAGRIDLVSILIALDADPFMESNEMESPIVQAVSHHRVDLIEEFLKYDHVRARVNDYVGGGTLLYHALYCATHYRLMIEHGHERESVSSDTLRLLIKNGARLDPIDTYERNALQVAVSFSTAKEVELLLELGCHELVNSSNHLNPPPLLSAMRSGKRDLFKILYDRGADTHLWFDKRSIRHWCACDRVNGLFVAHLLGDRRDDIDTESRDDDGVTPFQLAVLENNFPVADLFLQQGGDPYKLTTRGTTALGEVITSSDHHSIQGLKYLIQKDPKNYIVQPRFNVTALHYAAHLSDFMGDYLTNRSKFIFLLRTFHEEEHLHARTTAVGALPGGQTPLHYACQAGNYFAASELLLAGSKIDIKDDGGLTPLDWARKTAENFEEEDVEVMNFELKRDELSTLESLRGIIDLLESWAEKNRRNVAEEVNEVEKELDGLKFSQFGFPLI